MSFSLTTPQVRAGTKTVTRRIGWAWLEPGTALMACRKCMGLKPGEKVERIRPIRVVSVRREELWFMKAEDCAKEGYPDMNAAEFVEMFCEHMGVTPETVVTRIEFTYLD